MCQNPGLLDTNGNTIEQGFDQYGYNYQGHIFTGTYDSVDRNVTGGNGSYTDADSSDPVNPTLDDKLTMKWSDSWLANVDCNGDQKLDRGLIDGTAGGTSKGWLINQSEGDYDSDGNGSMDAHYSYFVKIVWVGPGGSLWGQYEIIERVLNDPAEGLTGLAFPVEAPGFGLNDNWTVAP